MIPPSVPRERPVPAAPRLVLSGLVERLIGAAGLSGLLWVAICWALA